MLTPEEALAAIRRAHAELVAAEAAEWAAVDHALSLRDVYRRDIAAALDISTDGLYKRLKARG